MNFFVNRVFAGIIRQDEVILEDGRPPIPYDQGLIRKEKMEEDVRADTGRDEYVCTSRGAPGMEAGHQRLEEKGTILL